VRPKGDAAGDWTDFNRSDPGVALLEVLSYAGDLLSYYNARSAAEQRLSTRRRYAVALAGLVLILFAWWRSADGKNDD
jgi:hypothetical protein